MRVRKTVRFIAIAVLALLAASGLSAQYRVGSKFGRKQIGNRNLMVHVTVAAPIGTPVDQVADRALMNRGASPLTAAPYAILGPTWADSDGVGPGADNLPQYYNGANDPTGAGSAAYNAGQSAWTQVATSRFAFTASGSTTRCPSLVDECPGPQVLDTFNDVGWCSLGALSPIFGGTLGVTWFEWDENNNMVEADVCLNNDATVLWASDGTNDIDVHSVMLHELGHVATLGHSRNRRAVMYASYLDVRRELHSDDVNGISFLYPVDDGGGEDPPTSCVVPDGLPLGSACTNDADCCSGKCKGRPSAKVCK